MNKLLGVLAISIIAANSFADASYSSAAITIQQGQNYSNINNQLTVTMTAAVDYARVNNPESTTQSYTFPSNPFNGGTLPGALLINSNDMDQAKTSPALFNLDFQDVYGDTCSFKIIYNYDTPNGWQATTNGNPVCQFVTGHTMYTSISSTASSGLGIRVNPQ